MLCIKLEYVVNLERETTF